MQYQYHKRVRHKKKEKLTKCDQDVYIYMYTYANEIKNASSPCSGVGKERRPRSNHVVDVGALNTVGNDVLLYC